MDSSVLGVSRSYRKTNLSYLHLPPGRNPPSKMDGSFLDFQQFHRSQPQSFRLVAFVLTLVAGN